MAYNPRGNVKKILDGMAAQDNDMEWGTEELAAIVGITSASVSSTMKAALREGLIFKQKRGVKTFYSLTSYEPEAEPAEFNASLYLDGDLVIYGAQLNEDDSVTITADQLAKLKKLIVWSPAA